MDSTELQLVCIIPLDLPLLLTRDLAGAFRPIRMGSVNATMHLPSAVGDDSAPDTRAVRAPDAAGHHDVHDILPDGWGHEFHAGTAGVVLQTDAVAVVVSASVTLADGYVLTAHPPGGPDVDQIKKAAQEWLDRFIYWAWVLTAQSLDLENPGPETLSRPSANVFLWAASGRSFSPIHTGGHSVIVRSPGDATAERLMNETALERAIGGADSATLPPLRVELLTRARMACRRGENRRAIVDLGTAAESVLTTLLNITGSHKLTLGGLTNRALQKGIRFPADIRSSLVDPRNAAVHGGVSPPRATTVRACEIVEELIGRVEPSFRSMANLPTVTRPQRQDLIIVKPRSAKLG